MGEAAGGASEVVPESKGGKEMLMRIWCYAWAHWFIFWDWAIDQIDHNDYLAGFVSAVFLMLLPWLVGAIDIVMR